MCILCLTYITCGRTLIHVIAGPCMISECVSPVLSLCLHCYQTLKLCCRFLCICGSEWEWNLSHNNSKWGKCHWFGNWVSSCNRQYQPCLSPGNVQSFQDFEASQHSVAEDSGPGCDIVSLGEWLLTFWRTVVFCLQGLSNLVGPLNSWRGRQSFEMSGNSHPRKLSHVASLG